MKRPAVIVMLILTAALALRVGEVQRTKDIAVNDAGSYMILASGVAQIGDFATVHGPGYGAGGTIGPSAYYPPGFPYLLAAVDLIDGHPTPGGPAIHPARLSQAVLGTITVGLIGLLALELFGPATALIALAIAAVYPVFVALSAVLAAENLLTALVLAAVWAALRARRSQRRRYAWIALAGAFSGLAALSHENGVLVVVPLIFAVWTARPRLRARALAAPALLIATAALTIAPWTIRNAVLLHSFVPVSDEAGITLVGTYNASSASFHRLPYKWRIFYTIRGEQALAHRAPSMTETQLSSRLLHQAFEYIGDHPLSPLQVAYHNTRRMFELAGSFAWRASAYALRIPTGTAEIGVGSFWLLCLLALAGAFTQKVRGAPRWLWAIPLLLALSIVLVNVETPRFREPIDPFVILLAACGVAAAADRARGSARKLKLRRGAPVGSDGEAPVSGRDAELVKMVERLA